MICADTSFLISLYGNDEHSAAARTLRAASDGPLVVHPIIDFEYANAVRALVFRRKIEPEQCDQWLEYYEAEKRRGFLLNAVLDQNAVFDAAAEISARHTRTTGNRAYDVLHIAAAKILAATEFWSFDGRQRALAAAEGLTVGP